MALPGAAACLNNVMKEAALECVVAAALAVSWSSSSDFALCMMRVFCQTAHLFSADQNFFKDPRRCLHSADWIRGFCGRLASWPGFLKPYWVPIEKTSMRKLLGWISNLDRGNDVSKTNFYFLDRVSFVCALQPPPRVGAILFDPCVVLQMRRLLLSGQIGDLSSF